MKRFIAILTALAITAACWAATPELACHRLLERKDLRTKGHDIVQINQPKNYFRSISARSDRKLLKMVKQAVAEDRKRAFSVLDGYDGTNGQDYTVMNIKSNGKVVSIGFYWTDSGYVHLFFQSDPAAVGK